MGDKEILRGISLSLDQGEYVAMVGPNGAGKTTLLKILALLQQPTRGQVLIDGEDAFADPVRMRGNIGVVSHHTLLYDNLTAKENLLFYGRLYDVPDLPRRLEQVLLEVGLEYVANQQVRTFSRGMQQRLAIARATLHQPKVLFLDEPYTGLDPKAAALLDQILQNLTRGRRTVFLVTHSFEQGVAFSDRVLLLVAGRLVHETGVVGLTAAAFRTMYRRFTEDQA